MTNYLDTDLQFNYCEDVLKDGFPVSSKKIRHFDPIFEPDTRDSVMQSHNHETCYINTKFNFEDQYNSRLYHQNCMTEEVQNAFFQAMVQHHPYARFFEWRDYLFDMIVVQRDESQGSRVALCHLMYPNGWAAEDSIGRSFSHFHREVAVKGKPVVPDNDQFINWLITDPKYHERIGAFSVKPDHRLDRHPSRAYPTFEQTGKAFVRFERQILFGLPEVDCFVFLIQTHLVDMRSRPELMENAILNSSEDCYCHDVLFANREFLLNYVRGEE